MKFSLVSLVFVLISLFLVRCDASAGDLDPIHFECVHDCERANCTKGGADYKRPETKSLVERAFWKCQEDCRYNCIWKTVKLYGPHQTVYQFYGKWPFIRFLWMQEPASVFFSLFNLLVHLKMFQQFLKRFSPTDPMYQIWTMYGFVTINTWVWSIVFHSRDRPFTELMDYLSAATAVYSFAYSIGMRILFGQRNIFKVLLTIVWVYFFLAHISLLALERFDYNYNMRANLICGGLSLLSSLVWVLLNYRKLPHGNHLIWFVFWTGASALLEVVDFPPRFWVFDAHALWHLATVPLPVFLWRFVIQDCKHLLNKNNNYIHEKM